MRGQSGAELAVKNINDAGGFEDSEGNCYTLTLSSNDMGAERTEAVALYRQAAADSSILAQVGPTTSAGFVPVQAIAGDEKLLVIANGSVADISEWNAWSYRVNSIGRTAIPPALQAVKDATGFERVAIVYDKENDGQVAAYQLTKELASSVGFEVVSEAGFSPEDQDFSALVSALQAAEPDLICVFSAADAGSRVSLQISNANVPAPQFTSDGGALDSVWWDNSEGAMEGSYTYLTVDLQADSGPVKDFVDQYTEAYPDLSPTAHSVWGYDTVYTIVAAITQANSADRDAVQAAMSQLDTTTPLGSHITFKNPPNGENLTPTIITVRVTGRGTYEILDQAN